MHYQPLAIYEKYPSSNFASELKKVIIMRNANKMTLLGAMLMTAVSAQAFNVKGTIVDKTT